jgi:DNA-directed RNA polymerase subunit N (RpoN/RPB10)
MEEEAEEDEEVDVFVAATPRNWGHRLRRVNVVQDARVQRAQARVNLGKVLQLISLNLEGELKVFSDKQRLPNVPGRIGHVEAHPQAPADCPGAPWCNGCQSFIRSVRPDLDTLSSFEALKIADYTDDEVFECLGIHSACCRERVLACNAEREAEISLRPEDEVRCDLITVRTGFVSGWMPANLGF